MGDAVTDDRSDLAWDATRDGLSALPVDLVEPVSWERLPEKDAVRIEMDAWGGVSVMRDRVAHILEGLEADEDLPAIVDRLVDADAYPSRVSAERNARNIILGLAGQGNVEIRLPPVPEVFGGRFERVGELGRGAVGVAWLCRDLEPNGERKVVVKHAWNWNGSLRRRDENLREEADLMARFDHPGIVTFVDGFEVDGRFHLVREFVEGTDLADLVLTKGALPRDDRLRAAHDVADVLETMHERSVWCLDLKPGNLMRRGEDGGGRFVLADLGHCREVHSDRIEVQRIPGTRGYLGPEIFEDRAATAANDIYGFGKLYEFLTTGYPPNQGEPVEDVIGRMEERGDPAPEEVEFVEACLARAPEDRPPSPSAALEILAADPGSN